MKVGRPIVVLGDKTMRPCSFVKESPSASGSNPLPVFVTMKQAWEDKPRSGPFGRSEGFTSGNVDNPILVEAAWYLLVGVNAMDLGKVAAG